MKGKTVKQKAAILNKICATENRVLAKCKFHMMVSLIAENMFADHNLTKTLSEQGAKIGKDQN